MVIRAALELLLQGGDSAPCGARLPVRGTGNTMPACEKHRSKSLFTRDQRTADVPLLSGALIESSHSAHMSLRQP